VPALGLGLVPIALLWQRTARPGPQVPTAALDLAPAERASWSTVLGGRVFVVTAVLLVAAAVLVGVTVTLWSGGIVAAAAVVTAAFGRIDVTADRRGLRLRSSLLGIPFKRIPLADIAAARSERIDPMQWGGWGYRVTPGRAGPLSCCTPARDWWSNDAAAPCSPSRWQIRIHRHGCSPHSRVPPSAPTRGTGRSG